MFRAYFFIASSQTKIELPSLNPPGLLDFLKEEGNKIQLDAALGRSRIQAEIFARCRYTGLLLNPLRKFFNLSFFPAFSLLLSPSFACF
jgi:hypothetical protein